MLSGESKSMDELRGYFTGVRETAEGFAANCPACDDTGRRFSFNEEKRVGCCHHAHCIWYSGQGGVTENRLAAFFSKKGIEYSVPETVKPAIVKDVRLPDEYKPIADIPKPLRTDLFMYLSQRGLPKPIVKAAHVGYCTEGKFWGYLIFPVLDDEGHVQYWQARRYKQREPKFRNPTYSKKTELVYRLNPLAIRPKRIIIIESIINNLTLSSLSNRKDLPIAVFGKTLSERQRDYILQFEKWLAEVVIVLDGPQEKDNTKAAAVKMATSLFGTVPAVKIVKTPEAQDVNSLGREKSWKLIDNAIAFRKNQNEGEFLYGEW
jgi:hypothetical protein